MAGRLTLSTIRDRVARSFGWTTEQLDGATSTRLTQYANEALQQFTDEHPWPFLANKITTITIPAAGDTADLPSDFGGLSPDSTPYFKDLRGFVLRPGSLADFQHYKGNINSSGIISRYVITFNQTTGMYQMQTWPPSQATTDIFVPYWVYPPDMVVGTDAPAIPVALHPTYLLCVLDYAQSQEEQSPKSDYHDLYREKLAEAIKKHGQTDSHNNNEMTGFWAQPDPYRGLDVTRPHTLNLPEQGYGVVN